MKIRSILLLRTPFSTRHHQSRRMALLSFCLSFREVEDRLAKRGIIVFYETIGQWCLKFGPEYARKLKRRQGRLDDTWFLDAAFIAITGNR